MARRSNMPSERMCCWPAYSWSVRGRMRAASGDCLAGASRPAWGVFASGCGVLKRSASATLVTVACLGVGYKKITQPSRAVQALGTVFQVGPNRCLMTSSQGLTASIEGKAPFLNITFQGV